MIACRNMEHPIYRVTSFKTIAPHTLRVEFDDRTRQDINFRPILTGEMYGPLREEALFNQVCIDPEVHTLVWPNGADFDPAIPHDWEERSEAMIEMARSWRIKDKGDGFYETESVPL